MQIDDEPNFLDKLQAKGIKGRKAVKSSENLMF